MEPMTLVAFAVAFFLFAASPGPDNLTVVARTITHGASAGIAYGLGTVTGILVFLALAVFGLSVVASEMGFAMTILRYAGAAWLIWTGLRLWTAKTQEISRPVRPQSGLFQTYLTGIALNLGNPKMPLFYVALLPNIIGADISLDIAVELAFVILIIEAVVIGGHVALALKSRGLLSSPKVIRRANRIAGSVMIGTGTVAIVGR